MRGLGRPRQTDQGVCAKLRTFSITFADPALDDAAWRAIDVPGIWRFQGVHTDDFGWYRLDARGNKPGVDARFCPPIEALAFAIRSDQERDLPEIWAEPLPQVIDALEKAENIEQVAANLPDVLLWGQR